MSTDEYLLRARVAQMVRATDRNSKDPGSNPQFFLNYLTLQIKHLSIFET